MNKLKTAIGSILILSILAGVTGAMLFISNPKLSEMEPVVFAGKSGLVYLIESRKHTSRIYGVDETGKVGFLYSENKQGSVISYVAADSEEIYFIREWESQMEEIPKKWELVRYNTRTKTANVIEGDPLKQISKVTGVSFDNENIYISGMIEKEGRYLTAVMYQTKRQDGENVFEKMLETQAWEDDAFLQVMYADDILSCLMESGTIVKSSSFQKVYISEDNNEMLTAMGSDGSYFWYYDQKNNTVRCSSAMVAGTPIVLDAAIRVKCGTPIGSRGMAMLIAVGNQTALMQVRGDVHTRIQDVTVPVAFEWAFRGQCFLVCFGISLLAFSVIGATFHLFVKTRRLAVKTTILVGYGAAILLTAVGILVYWNVTKDSQALPFTATDIYAWRNRVLKETLAAGGMTAILVVLAVWILMKRITRHIPLLTAAMDDISDGRFTMSDEKTANDEIGGLWYKLKEVCMSLAIKDYEMKNAIASYHRFVPTGIEELLNRASVMEISFGDLANITSSVGIVSVHNMEQVRQELDDEGFMTFVNQCYGHIQTNLDLFGGILLSNQFDLSSLKIALAGKPEEGIAFSLQLLGDVIHHRDENVARPDVFILFHYTEFLYAVAGTKTTAFPFLSSQEMAFLSDYAQKLAGIGIMVAFTEEYLKDIKNAPAYRYIGYISSKHDAFHYKLFELLDVFDDVEKQQRLGYDGRFQNAISLYYQNNFYLARNEFSAILKACPNDGVARWYLFACEYYFNNGEIENMAYQLFGIPE